MDLTPWRLEFNPIWNIHFKDFDKSIQNMVLKKLEQMKQPLMGRGLHSSRYLVEEVGQYRIAFKQHPEIRTKTIHFVGDHKQYEKWYREQLD